MYSFPFMFFLAQDIFLYQILWYQKLNIFPLINSIFYTLSEKKNIGELFLNIAVSLDGYKWSKIHPYHITLIFSSLRRIDRDEIPFAFNKACALDTAVRDVIPVEVWNWMAKVHAASE